MAQEVAGGYNGKILRVNLSNKSTTTEAIDELFCRQYIGGAGFVAYYLWKELKPGVDALGPDNKIIFALGPVSGLQLPGAAKHCIGAKSPLTGSIAKSEPGGFWAAELKRAGYDAIIVEGKAETPVYLWVHDGEADIRDARHLWGKETKETRDTVRAELGDGHIQLVMIGPAGENMVRYACVMDGLHDAAGRGGLGAVMGTKNLKAIAARGHKLPKIADREHVKEIRQQISANPYLKSVAQASRDITPLMLDGMYRGNQPVRNMRDGLLPELEQQTTSSVLDTLRVGMEGCYACPVRCKPVIKFEEPYRVDGAYGGPEYETMAALGSNCGIGDLKAICKGGERCNAYSLDTISTGSSIAFAMECFERGLLTTKDTDGIELRFGNGEAMLKAIDLIARRQGIGDLLAEGTARMAKKIGRGSEEFAMNVKGLETPMHEPRLSAGLGLGFMINPHGADHCCSLVDFVALSEAAREGLYSMGIVGPLSPDNISPPKVVLLRSRQLHAFIGDCLVVCEFLGYNSAKQAEVVSAVTGWNTNEMELLRVAERVVTMARLFNIREGFSATDDALPRRYYQPKTDGVLSDKSLNKAAMDKARGYYYTLMGWDAKGVPLPEKVEELEIAKS